ncbi:MAG: prolipoprotein diacylglyceryl transferase [Desulfobacteraceae bacterium]|nr:MAG: prolipoprotein diacylglyceryl transferase [Desulfobacteraceae bacterium]
MDQILFIGTLALIIFFAIWWGFRSLPKEHWQFMAVLPRQKTAHGKWKGLNLTYYGLLCANAYTFAVIIFFILATSVYMPMKGLCVIIITLLAVCLPASKLVARAVEKKQGTLTVGGAVFVGTLVAPWLVTLVNNTMGKTLSFHINVTVLLSCICIAYAFGEGLGRLACVSFGCCYGKPLNQCSPFTQSLFSKFYMIFSGSTKKISYASGFQDQKVLPIQIITAVVYSLCGLVCTALFLNQFFITALLISLFVTQAWRFFSEFLRADFRGSFKITPYQIMSALTIFYAAGVVVLFPAGSETPDLSTGLNALWNPWIILMIQSIWVASFIHTGRSVVTDAEISFGVVKHKI